MRQKIKISLATKYAVILAALFFVTMLVVIFTVREIVENQFVFQSEREIASALESTRLELSSRHAAIARQLQQLALKMSDEIEFRLYPVMPEMAYQPAVVDYAEKYMPSMGLQALEIIDPKGIVLSSGHYRHAFGKKQMQFILNLQTVDRGVTLAWFENPQEKFLCLTALESLTLGNQRFYLVGGIKIDPQFLQVLQGNREDIVAIQLPTFTISSKPEQDTKEILSDWKMFANNPGMSHRLGKQYFISEFLLPTVSGNAVENASVFLVQSRKGLMILLSNLNQRIIHITVVGLIVVIALSILLARAVALPLKQLAAAAGELSLEKLDVEFGITTKDEVGVLSEALRQMLSRLRRSRLKLAIAEQKAALADIARQVNHDIKNAFIPIRHVMAHWEEVEEKEPEKLPQIFHERKSTVLDSLAYLEDLARSYSRLKPTANLSTIDVNQLIGNLLKSYQTILEPRITLETCYDPQRPFIQADPVQLRRAFENILRNASEAIDGNGSISVTTKIQNGKVHITWKDNGCGIPGDIRQYLFVSRVTTKADGTGIGLANVKRIIEDFSGEINIESQMNSGTSVHITLPLSEEAAAT